MLHYDGLIPPLTTVIQGSSDDLSAFVANRGAPILLDGGLATSLESRGMPMKPPLWTSEALFTPRWRSALYDIHRDYVVAGADIITANTFRTGKLILSNIFSDDTEMSEVVNLAVKIAKKAVESVPRATALVAGSMAPVADCYRPDLVPSSEVAWEHHRWHARKLAAAGADILLCETFNSVSEALIAVQAGVDTGLPVWVSFVGQGNATLAGESFREVCDELVSSGAKAILLNCSTLETTVEFLRVANAHSHIPYGFYPNNEGRLSTIGSLVEGCCSEHGIVYTCDVLVRRVAELCRKYNVTIVGGCCGTTPRYIRELHALMRGRTYNDKL
ncbi:homocysteine S-methyltransferase family protein [Gluconacetobacter entanii]|uniref:homocysteine S-methyltransferase family protein n=1 Tax=Gluconacetobacter entanii TaxID=108528 RepID=UPI001C9348E5|nr:homocysteine S-methyltransferase family protein [Gluconacetobacter entanii]MBY4640945.1 homocysteine S-methyltransferase family protein [Gluconacetobacter entanii]MCW4579044.1 homocysteine S-methyltransferase family protein [Gluconacetobacter entanii]MCW4582444.1 homocysteine S-methyltransferase family protein [Gluconacetobacter entanii]MCW4585825.1 homocysteine S-methyltransferase family protein [Gluconacetobacter entanii]